MNNRIPQFNETEWSKLLDEVFGNDELSKLAVDLRRLGVNIVQAGRMYKAQGLHLPYRKAVKVFQEYCRTHNVKVSEIMTEACEIDLKVDQAWKERRRVMGRATDLDRYTEDVRHLI